MLRYVYVFMALMSIVACGDTEGPIRACTEEASKQLNQDICPVGTAIDINSSAENRCSAETDFGELSLNLDLNGEILCVSTGECLIQCKPIFECADGYESISREELVCK